MGGKKCKDFMAKNLDIHNHNMRRKLNLHVQHCNTALSKKSVIYVGISLCNKVSDKIKLKENLNLFKKDLKFFLLKHSFYSVGNWSVNWLSVD
jgi:hypothetical protein